MRLVINGEARDLRAATLADALVELDASARVATALNEVFVPAERRAETPLSEGDRIEILAPMQGG